MKKLFYLVTITAILAAVVPMASAAPPPQEAQEYIIAKGDWLSKLADKYLGNVLAYPAIVEATNAKAAEDASFAEIANPDLIEPGWKIWIPSPEEAAASMEGVEAPAEGIKVAVIGKSVHPYWANVEKGVADAAAALGVQADFFVPTQEDIAAQISTMEGYIAQGYDGIAVAPSDPKAMEATIAAAMEAGIPVITLDTDAPDSVRLAYVGTSNKAAGVVAGEEMAKLLPDGGQVAIGTGSLTALNSLERMEGFREGMGDAITVVEPVNNDKEDSATALELANASLVANPDLAGAFGVYAYNGPAWAKAIKEQGKAGTVKVVAFDATDEHIEFLKEGLIDVLVAQREYFQGYNSVELLTKMAQLGIEAGMADYGVPADGIVDTGVDVVTLDGLADYDATLTQLGIPHTWTP
jgi:ribose transport system substrate-binding protein